MFTSRTIKLNQALAAASATTLTAFLYTSTMSETFLKPQTTYRNLLSSLLSPLSLLQSSVSLCDSNHPQAASNPTIAVNTTPLSGMFYNFPASQLFLPPLPYPLWDDNWDFRKKKQTSDLEGEIDDELDTPSKITRHIILIRHGQYDETYREDVKRILTPLGREQSEATGRRILEMITTIDEDKIKEAPVIKIVHVSDLARAKETANIICSVVEEGMGAGFKIPRSNPDPNLNEGRPAHVIPSNSPLNSELISKEAPRIEAAFRKFFYRAKDAKDAKKKDKSGKKEKKAIEANPQAAPLVLAEDNSTDKPAADATVTPPPSRHEYEIIVCHGNVIRYFFMRALQLPPEAWLRLCTFNCSLTYFTVRPNGNVSCRMLGDVGHLEMKKTTFSGHHGFGW